MQLTVRKGSLEDLYNELEAQQDNKRDLIVPARDLWSRDGLVAVRNGGLNGGLLELAASPVFDTGTVAKLSRTGRPLGRAFIRGLREDGRTDIIDSVYNGLLHGNSALGIPGDQRRFFLRTFNPGTVDLRGADDEQVRDDLGYARALLSDSYRPIDNWDVMLTVIKGLRAAGFSSHVVRQADLTDDRMYLRVSVPQINALAPTLLRGYTSPYSRARGADNPVVEAGIVITNSETGGGAFTISPELVVQICSNGMTIKKDMIRKPHLGAKMDEGIKISEETRQANLALVASQVKDAVATFLDTEYLERVIAQIEDKSEATVDDPVKAVETITQRPAFSKSDAKGLLAAFMDGGDRTQGGLMNAITAYSQQVDDADRAYEMDLDALTASGFGEISGKVPVRR